MDDFRNMTDQGFPRRGRQLLTKGYQPNILVIFPRKLYEIKQKLERKGSRVPSTPSELQVQKIIARSIPFIVERRSQIRNCDGHQLIFRISEKGVLWLIHTGHQQQGLFRNMCLDSNGSNHRE